MMSSGEGVSMLNKLREDSSRLFVVFSEKGRTESFLSEVMKVEPPLLVLAKYDVVSFLVNLENAEFRFSDPYFEAANPEKAGKSFESCLQLSWPDARCRLFKVKDDFDPTK